MDAAELGPISAAKVIDARGTACPGPLLKAKMGIGTVTIGQILEIKSNDVGSRKDIAAWSGKMGHQFVGVIETDGHDRIFIKRGK